jgi:phosphatidylethanolamine-binding protein (PEBP) family uncharacterized protein
MLCFGAALSLSALYTGCTKEEEREGVFEICSSSFLAGQPIPTGCSCEGKPFGQGVSPELHWTAGPKGTKSYAIVFQDTSIIGAAPEYGNHWIIWNIPATVKSLPQGLSGEQFPPTVAGAQQQNAAPPQANGQYVFFGPCPSWQTFCSGGTTPRSNDTYSFTIYAFDFDKITVPAKDTTDKTNLNYVRQINAFLAAKAIGKAKLITTSNAAPTSFEFCPAAPAETLKIASTSFQSGQPIPTGCSCEGKAFGQGASPELHWTGGPSTTKSYAIVFQDTSIIGAAPEYGNHWIIWNIPATVKSLPQGLSGEQFPPTVAGAQQQNAAPPQANGQYVFFGPCPSWQTFCSGGTTPRSNDTYAFTIYTFDSAKITVPAKDTTDKTNLNYVRQINAFLAAKATGKAKLITTSNAAPTSFDYCPAAPAETLKITSTKFQTNGALPAAYGCGGKKFGEGISPELKWTGGPTTTKSYAIVFKDVSLTTVAPEYAYHWMIWNIPDSVKTLPEGLSSEQYPPAMKGAQQFSAGPDGGYAYMGPCPSWQTCCSKGEIPAVQDTYSFTIYALSLASVNLPAKDTTKTKNYVGQISKYFDSIAITKAEIKTYSGAVPDSAPQLCPVPAIPTPNMVDSEFLYLTIVGSDMRADSAVAVNKWYDSTHIPLLMQYPGLLKSVRYKNATAGAKPGYFAFYDYKDSANWAGINASTPFDSANKELAAHWKNGEYTMDLAISYKKIQSWVKKDYTGSLKAVTVVGVEFTAGKEDIINNWYNTTHIPLIMKYPGIKKAVRYKKVVGGVNTDSLPTYVAVYYYPTATEQTNQGTSPEWQKVLDNMTKETADDLMTGQKVIQMNEIFLKTR